MNFKLIEWKENAERYLEEGKEIEAKMEKEGCIYPEKLPVHITDGEGKLSIVFAGQYSAGKSSILKMLTGNQNIAISAKITTDKAISYDWNGIEVIDTPGIATGIHEEHDEISAKAIANADLLVYVLTTTLFDNTILKQFKRIAFEQNKINDMILVVNKMMSMDKGNTQSNRDILLSQIKENLQPYNVDNLKVVFTDAKYYLDSIDEDDEEMVEYYRKESGIVDLQRALNSFAEENDNIQTKLKTQLYKINDILASMNQGFDGNENEIAICESCKKQRKLFVDAKYRINSILSHYNVMLKNTFLQFADNYIDSMTESSLSSASQLESVLIEIANKNNEDVYNELNDLFENLKIDYGSYLGILSYRLGIDGLNLEEAKNKQETIALLNNANERIINLFGKMPDKEIASLANLFVKDTLWGKTKVFLGIGQSTRITNFRTGVAVLGVAVSVLNMFYALKNQKDIEERERKNIEQINKFRNNIAQIADNYITERNVKINNFVGSVIDKRIQELDEGYNSMMNTKTSRNAIIKTVSELTIKINKQIAEIQASKTVEYEENC